MAVTPWTGARRIAIVPVFNRLVDREPPADWEDQVRRRAFSDPDPGTGRDLSFQFYLQALSYGQASLEGEVFPGVWADDAEVNIPAMESLPSGHGYEALLAVLPHDDGRDRGGHAFDLDTPVNGITRWARVAMFTNPLLRDRQPLGIWAQELFHMECRLWEHPKVNGYDPMDGRGATLSTHACVNTKSLFGWLPEGVVEHVDGTQSVELHAVAQPASPGRVTAVRMRSERSANHFVVEARVGTDPFDAMVPQEGVLVCEVSDGDKVDLRTDPALPKGQSYDNADERLRVTVDEEIPAGFRVTVTKIARLVDRSAEYRTPPAAGPPTACVIPGLGVHNIAYRDGSGQLHELWRDAQGVTGTTNLTANAGAPTAAGNPFAYADTSKNQEILLFRGSDGNVRSLYWSTGAVGHDDLSGTAGSPKAAGEPVGYYKPDADVHTVVYRTGDGHLHTLWWAGVEPVKYDGDYTAHASAPPAAGDPSAFVDADGVNIVVFRGSDGHIRDLYWSSGPVQHEDLSGFAGTPQAAGDPFGYFTPHDNTHQVVYPAVDGHVYELYWQGAAPVTGWDLSAPSGAPAPAGNLAAYYSAGTHTKHVMYRSANGDLHEIWWVPGGGTPAHANLTEFAGAPRAADRPAAFTVEGPNTQHVAFRGTDNDIHEMRW